MGQFQSINIWSEQKLGGASFNPMPPSMLWLPDDFTVGSKAPAMLFVHGWGGYSDDQTARQLGDYFSNRGYLFLGLGLRRRGIEGQLLSAPENDHHDIVLGINYLQSLGVDQIVLLGEQMGAFSAVSYASQSKDKRITAVCSLNPVLDPAAYLTKLLGHAAYSAKITDSSVALRQGAIDTVVYLDAGNLRIQQKTASFLQWWGNPLEGGEQTLLNTLPVPWLIVKSPEDDGLSDISIDCETLAAAQWPQQLEAWLTEKAIKPLWQLETKHLLCKTTDGTELNGLQWQQAGQTSDVAIVLMHGLTSSHQSPLFAILGPELARLGVTAVALQTRRSGIDGHNRSVLDNDLEDLDAWLSRLQEQGINKFILAGASMGSLSVGRYQSIKQNPAVIAIAHLMPTADCPDWFERAAGRSQYVELVERAEQAIEQGDPDRILSADIRQPAPSPYQAYFNWTQGANAWLSWWGPKADSSNSEHMKTISLPILLLSGDKDSYNDEARFAELKAAAVNASSVDEVWYADIDHGLAGAEKRTASDIISWIKTRNII